MSDLTLRRIGPRNHSSQLFTMSSLICKSFKHRMFTVIYLLLTFYCVSKQPYSCFVNNSINLSIKLLNYLDISFFYVLLIFKWTFKQKIQCLIGFQCCILHIQYTGLIHLLLLTVTLFTKQFIHHIQLCLLFRLLLFSHLCHDS